MATDVGSAEPVRSAAAADSADEDHAPDKPGLRDPLFFVSHANATGIAGASRVAEADQLFVDFFGELSQHVNELHYRRSGADPGFMDLTMEGGLAWEREVLKAVGTCHVFVALLSSPYVNHKWCGLEWCAFRLRRSWRLDMDGWTETNECIVPVLWAPLSDAAMPPAVLEVERFSPPPLRAGKLASAYREQGLRGLKITDPASYAAAVWWLALEIKQKLDDYRVESRVPRTRHDLANVFETGES
jgi:hypothetical protein